DGKLDFATASIDYGTVEVLLGNGAGTFGPASGFSTGSSPQSLAAADVNGDGKVDLATAGGYNDVSVLLGNGLGSFGAAQHYATGRYPYAVAAADFNGDGKPDLVT